MWQTGSKVVRIGNLHTHVSGLYRRTWMWINILFEVFVLFVSLDVCVVCVCGAIAGKITIRLHFSQSTNDSGEYRNVDWKKADKKKLYIYTYVKKNWSSDDKRISTWPAIHSAENLNEISPVSVKADGNVVEPIRNLYNYTNEYICFTLIFNGAH